MATAAKKKTKKSIPLNINIGQEQSSWADEMENKAMDSTIVYKNVMSAKFPSAPRAAFETEFDFSKVPENPPFRVAMKNLPYEVSKDRIVRFFGDAAIIEIKLPERNVGKAIGYVEFGNRIDLIEALKKNKEALQGREIAIELTTTMSQGNKFMGNWKDNSYNNKYQNRDNYRRGSDYTSGPGMRPRNFEYGQRNGNNSFATGPGFLPPLPPQQKRPPYAGSMSSDYYGNRPPNNPDYQNFNGGDTMPTYPQHNNYNKTPNFEQPQNFPRYPKEPSAVSSKPQDKEAKRPSLDLKPRTKSINPEDVNTPAEMDPVKHASIFGSAKPVDTTKAESKVEKLLEEQEKMASTKLQAPKNIVSRSVSQSSERNEDEEFPDDPNIPEKLPHMNRGRFSQPHNVYPPPQPNNMRSSQQVPASQGYRNNDYNRRPSQQQQQQSNRYGLMSPSNPRPPPGYGQRRMENDGRSYEPHQQQQQYQQPPPRYQGTRSVDYGSRGGRGNYNNNSNNTGPPQSNNRQQSYNQGLPPQPQQSNTGHAKQPYQQNQQPTSSNVVEGSVQSEVVVNRWNNSMPLSTGQQRLEARREPVPTSNQNEISYNNKFQNLTIDDE